MKYLATIALVLGSFALAQSVQANEGGGFQTWSNCPDRYLIRDRNNNLVCTISSENEDVQEIEDLHQLADKEDAADSSGESGSDDFGGEGDQAAASTAAE